MNGYYSVISTAQKMKFFIKDFFCKCDQIRRKLRIWSHLLKKSLMENFIFCAVQQEMVIIILQIWLLKAFVKVYQNEFLMRALYKLSKEKKRSVIAISASR